MRIPTGSTDRVVFFVAVDSSDLKTRETGLTSFTVYYSLDDAGSATAMTTPTVTEIDATNMPGVYSLLLDESGMTTLTAGHDTEELSLHITQAAMAPVTRTVEIYRPETTQGNTLDVTATGAAGIDWANVESQSTSVTLSGTTVGTVSALAANSITASVIATDAIDADALASTATDQVQFIFTSTATGGTTTTLIDATGLSEPDTDYWKGMYVAMTTGDVAGQIRLITAYDTGTGTITFTPAMTQAVTSGDTYGILWQGSGIDEVSSDAYNEIADGILARNVAGGSSTGRTVKQALYALRNKVAISGSTMTVYQTDDSTSEWTSTITTDGAANPIVTSDPA